MNPLLAQFLAEAADLLGSVDEGLLQLEREPGDAELINEVFRAAHTLKGSSGLFDFPELTRLTHAAEDLLDAVRAGALELDSAMADDLLATFDLIRAWLAHVTAVEQLPPTAADDAAALIVRLRTPLGEPVLIPEQPPPAAISGPAAIAPAWIRLLDERAMHDLATWLEITSATVRFVRYLPDPDCFFRGEDPLHVVRQVPALEQLAIVPPAAWPASEEYDEYVCLVGFVLATRAAVGELSHLFRYVNDQVEIVELSGEAIYNLYHPPTNPPAAPLPTEPPLDPAVVADARSVLDAARSGLTLRGEVSGPRLISVARAVTAAARALRRPAVSREAGKAELGEAIDRLLADRPLPPGHGPAPAGPPVDAVPPAAVTEAPAVDARADDPGQVGTRTLKVDQEKVDHLMELVGELNVAKNGLSFLAEAAEEEFGSRVLSRRIKDQYAGMHRIAEDLQAAVMDVRMLPLSVSFSRFPRLVRDLSRRLGKTIELVTEGEDTMADKDVIEALADPLVHLVRNSLDHGIERPAERLAAGKPAQAQIRLAAVADGDAVVVEVIDDGGGIDPARVKRKAYEKGLIGEDDLESLSDTDAVNLVFLPGFSTADAVSDLSGRGVGMDAVKASVERMGGTVVMRSTLGAGTTTRMRLPLSMAVTQVMVVSVAGQRFGIPVDLVVETVRVPAGEIERILHQEVIVLRGEVVPVVDLAEALGMPWHPEPEGDRDVLVASVGEMKVGLLVERFHREVDVILKPMEGLLADSPEFCGTALLGDGLVLLVINLKEVLSLATRAV